MSSREWKSRVYDILDAVVDHLTYTTHCHCEVSEATEAISLD